MCDIDVTIMTLAKCVGDLKDYSSKFQAKAIKHLEFCSPLSGNEYKHYCPSCNNELGEKAYSYGFCPYCGQKVKWHE